jgi:hypothetical protein
MTDDIITDAELVEPDGGGLDLGPFGPMLAAMGIDVNAMLAEILPADDPDAIGLDDIAVALTELDAKLDAIVAALTPLVQLLNANAGKLKRLGITV